MGDFEEEPVNMDDVDENAGESSTDLANTLDSPSEDISTDPESVINKQTETTLEKMSESLKTDSPIVQETVDDASLDEPKTNDGKKVKSYWERCKDAISSLFSSEQKENGEEGQDPNDSEKSKSSFMDKYGKWALLLALLGVGVGVLSELGKSLTGCYQIYTNSSSYSTPTKVGCVQSSCSCAGVNTSPNCANPTCNSTLGQSKGVNYYWQNISALQALATLPGIMAGGVAAAAANLTGSLSKSIGHLLLIGGGVIGVLAVLYMIYKFYLSKQISKETPAPDIIAKFKLRSNYKLKYM